VQNVPSLPDYVRLVAVTKERSTLEIEPLIQQGITWFGENRIQEIQEKWPSLKAKYPHIKLQFVGRLQSNKAQEAIDLCDSIISVDRPSLVDALCSALLKNPKPMEFLAQVNLGSEAQKGGVAPEKLDEFLNYCHHKGLLIQGLMTIPPIDQNPQPFFHKLRQLCDEHKLTECSMGMSDDYEIALKERATQVRIGRFLWARGL